MFWKRFASSVVLVIMLASLMYFGGNFLFLFLVVVSFVAYFEMQKAMKVHSKNKPKKRINALEVIGCLSILAYYGVRYFGETETYIMLTITLSIILSMMVYVFTFPKFHANQVVASIFAFIYAPIMLSYIYLTRELDHGIYIVWLIFVSSWICDTCAYLVGMTIGKHKLAPTLSPKKSIEGAIGGIAGSAIVGFIYALVLVQLNVVEQNYMWIFPFISAVGAVISQIGDLAASAIKRNQEIKDYGAVIPGHGGIMDRFDSVIFTAPMIYYLAVFLLQSNYYKS